MNPGSADAGHGDPSRLMAFGSDRAASKRLPQLPSYAQPARPHGGFTTIESTIRQAHDAWYGDDSGILLMKRVVQAADRGVHVRLIVDDLLTIGRDFDTATLDAHPNIEIGFFNTWCHQEVADTSPTVSKFIGLHTTAMVVDRNRAFIGSMNLDPRSAQINSEMGAIIDSPCLAETLARLIERDMTPENSWHVQLGPQGDLHWVSGDQVLSTQPARSVWQRIEDLLFMMFPRNLY